jgi:hypothetical protein
VTKLDFENRYPDQPLGRLHMSSASKFEDQFAIQQLPAKASGKLLPYSVIT